MELEKIQILNFRSIKDLEFDVKDVNQSRTFCLLGINESGKSSFLRAMSLIANNDIKYPHDYFDDSQPVNVVLYYQITNEEKKELHEHLTKELKVDKTLTSKIEVEWVEINYTFFPVDSPEVITQESIKFKQDLFTEYKLEQGTLVKKARGDDDSETLDLNIFFSMHLDDYFWKLSHDIIFWQSTPEYLILDEIDLSEFATNPEKVSIPLKNCFYLAGIDDIGKKIGKTKSPAAIQNLEDLLSYKVTKHINTIWPEHQIKIKFQITSGKLTFLIEDKGVKFQNKTTTQRSDGFRQLVSFLLTLSAENVSDELSNKILLLDEPETHLHPTAQLNLLKELVALSKNQNNNIVFFATHSNYMIDKNNLERCYKVHKERNQHTKFDQFEKQVSSYAEINFEAFEISTNDYHNELYGFLEESDKAKLNSLPKNKQWKDSRNGNVSNVSLATYIRHSIHHPENTLNKKFTETELKASINKLRELKYG